MPERREPFAKTAHPSRNRLESPMPPTETEPLPLGDRDADLVLLLRTGHSPAFAALMRRHNQRL
jgi:hypothetical protein